jgi:hypothetical protein
MTRGRPAWQTTARVVCAVAVAAWGASLVDAFVARRYLHGDASYFLLSMLSEGRIAPWCYECWSRIYTGRMGTLVAYELPTYLASLVIPGHLSVLERIYGATLLLHPVVGLGLAALLVRRRWLLLLPLASIFLGVLNTSLYAAGNSSLLHSLFWCLLLRLLEPERIARWEWVLLFVVALPTAIAYETMAFYGLLLLFACWRRLAEPALHAERVPVWILVAWFSLGIAFAALSVLFPFDASNRESFLQALLHLPSLSYANPGVPASLVGLLVLTVVFVRPSLPTWVRGLLLFATAVAASYQALFIALRPQDANFHGQIQGRVLLAVVPVVLGALTLRLTQPGKAPATGTLHFVALLVGIVGLGQVAWHLQATRLWVGMLDTLRFELEARSGPLPFPASIAVRRAVGRQPILLLHAQWPLPALSLLLARNGLVRSSVVFRSGAFYPLDLEDGSVLRRLERCGLDFSAYREALLVADRLDGERVMDFGPEGQAWRYAWGDWSAPERGGTWVRGTRCSLRFTLAGEGEATILRARVGANVGPDREALDALVLVNGTAVGTWTFRADRSDRLPRVRTLALPTGLLRVGERNEILFEVQGPPPSGEDRSTLLFSRLSLRSKPTPEGRIEEGQEESR